MAERKQNLLGSICSSLVILFSFHKKEYRLGKKMYVKRVRSKTSGKTIRKTLLPQFNKKLY